MPKKKKQDTPALEIDTDKECERCHEMGAGKGGLCLDCVAAKLKADNEKETSMELVEMKYTPDEKIALGLKVAEQIRTLKRIESQKKSATADFTAREKSASLELDELSRKIEDGFEMRREECEVQYDNELKRVDFVIYQDGVPLVVKQRKMTPDEIQRTIPGMD